MKKASFLSSLLPRNERRKGVALIIVLAVLVLITALVVAFLVRTGSERTAAASYRATARTRQLADMVVNLVQAQVNQATNQGAASGTAAWASQPGAIRVFDNQGNQTIYKLYSSGTLTANSYSALAGDLPLAANPQTPPWLTSPSLWVDLNTPVPFTLVGQTQLGYPILDPRNPSGTPTAAFGSGAMDGFQVNLGILQGGTNINSTPAAPMPVQWLYVLQNGTIVAPLPQSTGSSVILPPSVASGTNPIVGRIAFWTDDDTARLNINTAGDGVFWDTPRYTAPDEWVMAFLSPASGEYQRYPGHPGTTSLLNVLNAVNPTAFPANYLPGTQPSTSITSYTLNLPVTPTYPFYSPYAPPYGLAPTNFNFYTPPAYNNLFGTLSNGTSGTFTPGLCPRYAYGGSQEVTNPQSTNFATYNLGYAASTTGAPVNGQRLYPSVGELLFSASSAASSTAPQRFANGQASGGTAPLLNRQELETAKFFLTAHSRAPELNLYGTPRVSIWPFTTGPFTIGSSSVTLSGTQPVPPPSSPSRNTATDALLAFASTISGTNEFPYYFMRNNNIDPYTDFSIMRNGMPQNQQILGYLDALMSMPEPGFSLSTSGSPGSFYGKYGQTGSRQILTEIMDYVRTTDAEDGDVIYNSGASYMFGNIAYGPNNGQAGWGNVVPTVNSMWASTSGTLEGFGSFPRPTCVMIHFVAVGQGPITYGTGSTSGTFPALNIPPEVYGYPYYGHDSYVTGTATTYTVNTTGTTTVTLTGTAGVVAPNRIAIQAFVYVQFVDPASARLNSNPPVFWIAMNGLNTLALSEPPLVSATSLGLQTTGSAVYNINLGGGVTPGYGDDAYCGQLSIFGETNAGAGGNNGRASAPPSASFNRYGNFPFYSQIITMPYTYGSVNSLTLTGGTDVVLQLCDSSASADPIETVNLNFATVATSGTFPFPVNVLATPGTVLSGSTALTATGPIVNGSNVVVGTGNGSSTFLSNARILGTGCYVTITDTNNTITGDMTQNDRWMANDAEYFDSYHDSAVSLVLSASSGWDDPRMLAIPNVPSTAFIAHQNWGRHQMSHDFTYSPSWIPFAGGTTSGKLVMSATYDVANPVGNSVALPCVPSADTNGVAFIGGTNVVSGFSFGDWDNGVGWTSDGPWINRADEGGASIGTEYSGNSSFYYLPYYTAGNGLTNMGPGIFSPNREVPSPVTFGSLPTGVPAGFGVVTPSPTPAPWQTLLFRPGAVIKHPGRGQPVNLSTALEPPQPPYNVIPDHLLLDLFWMPAAEPYAISEPFSTAGKVNLNYQILPFGYVTTTATTAYIRRDTGVRSALESLKIAAVPSTSAANYKSQVGGNWWGQWGNVNSFAGANGGNTARLPIDVDQTLQQFDVTFNNGGIFQSASEICDVYLVPMGFNLATFSSIPSLTNSNSWYGSTFAMVGDNVRERPYSDIYSRITTKSNTFTVYFTVQELKNSPASPANQWTESTGSVVGEYRGSTALERYILQNSSVPDYLDNPGLTGSTSMESYYRWRVIENNQFAP